MTERKAGNSRLVYNKETRTIDKVEADGEPTVMVRLDDAEAGVHVMQAAWEAEREQTRTLIQQHMGWLKQFSFDDPEWQARNWKDNMMRIRQQLDRMTHDFRVQI
jgi:hypothetical protein